MWQHESQRSQAFENDRKGKQKILKKSLAQSQPGIKVLVDLFGKPGAL
jgi:hypothetical protein